MPQLRRALLVVDVQQEYFEGPLTIGFPPVEQSLARILEAIDAAAEASLPVAVVQHEKAAGAPLFAAGSSRQRLHARLEERLDPSWKRIPKGYASCFDHTDLAAWLAEQKVETITLVGYMTNNCILATAAAAAPRGLNAEVLSDATGAISLANTAGSIRARELQETLLVLLQSSFAAVATTAEWAAAVAADQPLNRSNLLASAAPVGAAEGLAQPPDLAAPGVGSPDS